MHPQAYATLATMEPVGWYYQARARCLARLIGRFVAPDGGKLDILDVGCGTGGTSTSLGRFGHVTGLEPSPMAIALLKARYPHLDVVPGGVADIDALLAPASFDLATIMGVLYHRDVADPAGALRQVNRVLRPDGWIVWNEAVYPILARAHDELVQAGRRFHPRAMRTLLEAEGFRVRFGSHLLGWGFPFGLALAMMHRAKRWVLRGRRDDDPGCDDASCDDASCDDASRDDRPLPRLLNALLRELTYFEWACSLAHLKVPCGVSYLVIAQKQAR